MNYVHLRRYWLTLSIDDVTNVYLQQTQGIGLSIHLNELLHYSTAPNSCSKQGLCNVAGVLNAHALTKHDARENCRAKEQLIVL